MMNGIRRSGLRAFHRDEAGAVAVEFAIVAMVFILICLGIFEFGRAFYVRGNMSFAAEQGVRDYIVHQNRTDKEIITKVKEHLLPGDTSTVTVKTTADGSSATVGPYTVSVSAAYMQGGLDFRKINISRNLELISLVVSDAMALNVERRMWKRPPSS